jgi:hypothetical protein
MPTTESTATTAVTAVTATEQTTSDTATGATSESSRPVGAKSVTSEISALESKLEECVNNERG